MSTALPSEFVSTPRVDQFVDAFEAALLQDNSADLSDFLPGNSDPDFDATATELLRVDLELRWRQGSPKRLADYRQEFSELLSDENRFGTLAFEEYRLRIDAGERIKPADYERQFEVDTTSWPPPSDPTSIQPQRTAGLSHETWEQTLADFGSASERLIDAISQFPEIGSEFAGFELERLLGEGSFGRVYLARQAGLAGRPMVLKITAGASGEAHCLARLQHTNIVPVYSVHDEGNLRAICMPFLGSRTVKDLLDRFARIETHAKQAGDWFDQREGSPSAMTPTDHRSDRIRTEVIGRPRPTQTTTTHRGKPLAFERAVAEFASAIAGGLEYAHQRGIVHRDLKPANILVTDDGQPLLLDFNVSEDTSQHQSTPSIAGTLAYMAPEQLLRRGNSPDPRSDIYSFGVIFYELLTGQHPFRSELAAEDAVFRAYLNVSRRQIADPRTHNPAIPADLAAIVLRCLTNNVDQRYQSAGELQTDLERHFADQPLVHAVDRSSRNRFAKWRRRHPRMLAIAAMLPLFLLLALSVRSLLVRNDRINHLRAEANAERLLSELPGLRVDLSVLSSTESAGDLATLKRGMDAGNQLLAGVLDRRLRTPDWMNHLTSSKRETATRQLAEVAYLLAGGAGKLAVCEPTSAAERTLEAEAHHHLADFFAQQLTEDASLAIAQQRSWLNDPKSPASSTAAERELTPTQVKAEFLPLYTLMRAGRHAEAAEMLEQLRRRSRFDFSTWLLLGDTYLADAKIEKAEACYEAAVSLWPGLDRCYFHRGLCRMSQSRHAAAIDDFNTALELFPEHRGALLNRGVCYLNTGDFALAEADFSTAIDNGCSQTRVWFLRARARKALGDLEGAEADHATAMDLQPTDEQSAVALGNAYLKTDPDKALQYYRLAHRLAPHKRNARRNVAHVLGERYGQNETAIQVLDDLIRDFNKSHDVVARGVLHARLGNRDAALSDAARASEMDGSAKVLFQVGCIYALTSEQHEEDADIAVHYLAKAIKLDGRWAEVAARDTDLTALRSSHAFRSLLSAAFVLNRSAEDGPDELNQVGQP